MNRLEFLNHKGKSGIARPPKCTTWKEWLKWHPKPKWCYCPWDNPVMACWGMVSDIDSGKLNPNNMKQVTTFCKDCGEKAFKKYSKAKEQI